MEQRSFHVRAIWDPVAKVYTAESDIEGLNIESPTFLEFQEVVRDFAVELIVENHYQNPDVTAESLSDWIPAIFISTGPDVSSVC